MQILGDASSLERAFGKATHLSSGFGSTLGRMAKVAGAAALAIGGGLAVAGVKAVKSASNLEEQINKTNVVFGKSGKEVIGWSKDLTRSFGLSQRAALEAAGTYGNMLVPMGFTRKAAGEMSKQMVELAGDMASFNNASPEETLDALRSGLAGETEPLRRFGVFLNDARLKQEAMSMGIYDGVGALTASQKAQATYSVILKDTADTQGDFARTSDSVANQQRILKAEFENAAAAAGKALLPAATALLGVASKIIPVLAEWARVLASVLGPAITRLVEVAGPVFERIIGWVRGLVDDTLPSLRSQGESVFSSLGDIIGSLWRIAQPIFNAIRDVIEDVVIPVLRELWDIAQAAFEGIARVLQDHEPEIRRIMEVIGTVMRTLGTIIREVVQNVIAPILRFVFGEVLPTVIGIAITAIDLVIRAFQGMGTAVSTVVNAVREVVSTAWNAIASVTTTVWNAVSLAVTTVVNAIRTLVTTGTGEIRTAVQTAWNAIQTITTTVWNAVRTLITTVVTAIRTVVTTAVGAVRTAVTIAWNAIDALTTRIWGEIRTAITTAMTTVRERVTAIAGDVRQAIFGAWDAVREKTANAWNAVLAKIRDVMHDGLQAVRNLISAFGDAAVAIGRAIVEGILSGASGIVSRLRDALGGWIGDALSHIPIPGRSPIDHAAMQLIGIPIVEGAVEGVKGMARALRSELSDQVGAAIKGVSVPTLGIAASASLGGAFGGGGGDIAMAGASPGGLASSSFGPQELTIRIPVFLDSRQITEVVYEGLKEKSRSSGSLFSASPGVRL